MPPVKKTTGPKVAKPVVKKASASKPKPKKVSAPKKASTKTPTPAPVEQEIIAPPVAPTTELTVYSDEFTHILGQLKTLQTTLKELTIYTTKLEKRVAKEQKVLHKKAQGKGKRKNAGNKSPSGFSKPGPISDELRTFLGVGKDELVARTEVTKKINTYCREKGLQDKNDKRKLLPDKTLTKLLRIGKGDELTFFNLQKYMKVHFPNKDGVYPKA
tara:strand:- start:473 stop:1117 length:645 start_codon:yes stop_codon:yes gene_type:complete